MFGTLLVDLHARCLNVGISNLSLVWQTARSHSLFVERVPAGIEAWQRAGVTLDWVFTYPDVMANI